MNKKRSPWAIAFFVLLSLNVLAVVLIAALGFSKQENFIEKPVQNNTANKSITVSVSKAELNTLIDDALASNEWAVGDIEYDVELDEFVTLKGEVPVFSSSIQMQVDFIPKAQPNGDIVLQANALQIGGLQVPISYIMRYIAEQYEFPEWVQVDPDQNTISVALSQYQLKNGAQIKASSFDLSKDDQQFTVELP